MTTLNIILKFEDDQTIFAACSARQTDRQTDRQTLMKLCKIPFFDRINIFQVKKIKSEKSTDRQNAGSQQ